MKSRREILEHVQKMEEYANPPEPAPEPDPREIYPKIACCLRALGTLNAQTNQVILDIRVIPGHEALRPEPFYVEGSPYDVAKLDLFAPVRWQARAEATFIQTKELPLLSHIEDGTAIDYEATQKAMSEAADRILDNLVFESGFFPRIGEAVADLQAKIRVHLEKKLGWVATEALRTKNSTELIQYALTVLQEGSPSADAIKWPVEDVQIDVDKVLALLRFTTSSYPKEEPRALITRCLAFDSRAMGFQRKLPEEHKDGLRMWQSLELEEQDRYYAFERHRQETLAEPKQETRTVRPQPMRAEQGPPLKDRFKQLLVDWVAERLR